MTRIPPPAPAVVWTQPGDDPDVRIVVTTYESGTEKGLMHIPAALVEYSDGADEIGVTHWYSFKGERGCGYPVDFDRSIAVALDVLTKEVLRANRMRLPAWALCLVDGGDGWMPASGDK